MKNIISKHSSQNNLTIKILVTGGTGFIGKHFLKELSNKNVEVLVLTRSKKKKFKKIIFYKCDLNNVNTYKKKIINFNPECLVHLAWEGIPNFTRKSCSQNLKNSKNLIKIVTKVSSCKKIIISGTCFEIVTNKGKSDEKAKLDESNYFSFSKNKLRKWIDDSKNKNLFDYIWLRIFYVYGPGQRKEALIPYLIRSFKQNKQPVLKNIYNTVDFVYIEDVIKILLASIFKKIPSGVYNAGSGYGLPVYKVCRFIEKKITNKVILFSNRNIKKKNSTTYFWSDNKKTNKVFKEINYTSIENGLKKTISKFY